MRLTVGLRRMLAMAVIAMACSEGVTNPPPAVATVLVSPGTATIESGGTLQLNVQLRDAEGNPITDREVTWSSTDTSRLTVSNTGLVQALPNRTAVGLSARIIASVGNVSDDAELIVQPVVAASLTIQPLAGTVGAGESPTLSFEARDAAGELLLGRQPDWVSRDVSVVIVASNGQLSPQPFVDVNDRSTWIVATLGAVMDSVEVSVAPSSLASIQIIPRDPALRFRFSKRLRVVGTTTGGQQVFGLAPTYTSSNTSVAVTTAAGVVTASNSTPGTTMIRASLGGLVDSVPLVVDACGAAAPGTYTIELRNVGPALSAEAQAAFDCAAARIRAMIKSPLAPVLFPSDQSTGSNCLNQTISAGTNTSGVIILMRVATIDGPGGTLGSAGPCLIRSASRLTVVGKMEFDEADLAGMISDGTLREVILHEMLHVIGIGTVWRDPQFPTAIWTGEVGNPGFLGERAIKACREEHGGVTPCAAQVPVEDCVGIPDCGVGTQYGHWREQVFDHELMTGYIDLPRSPLSRMTIAALGDLGYGVDLEQAEDYMLPTPGLMAGLVLKPENLSFARRLPEPSLPTHTIDEIGRVRPILH